MCCLSLVRPFARLVVALKDLSRSLDGETCFCLDEAVAPRLPEVVVAPGLFLGERPVLVFLVFIFIFLIKI
jgi:hypothetical protein